MGGNCGRGIFGAGSTWAPQKRPRANSVGDDGLAAGQCTSRAWPFGRAGAKMQAEMRMRCKAVKSARGKNWTRATPPNELRDLLVAWFRTTRSACFDSTSCICIYFLRTRLIVSHRICAVLTRFLQLTACSKKSAPSTITRPAQRFASRCSISRAGRIRYIFPRPSKAQLSRFLQFLSECFRF